MKMEKLSAMKDTQAVPLTSPVMIRTMTIVTSGKEGVVRDGNIRSSNRTILAKTGLVSASKIEDGMNRGLSKISSRIILGSNLTVLVGQVSMATIASKEGERV